MHVTWPHPYSTAADLEINGAHSGFHTRKGGDEKLINYLVWPKGRCGFSTCLKFLLVHILFYNQTSPVPRWFISMSKVLWTVLNRSYIRTVGHQQTLQSTFEPARGLPQSGPVPNWALVPRHWSWGSPRAGWTTSLFWNQQTVSVLVWCFMNILGGSYVHTVATVCT